METTERTEKATVGVRRDACGDRRPAAVSDRTPTLIEEVRTTTWLVRPIWTKKPERSGKR